MGKISGYLLSSALVVACLWVNVSSFPNVISADSIAKTSATSEATEKEAPNGLLESESPSASEESETTDAQRDAQVPQTREVSRSLKEGYSSLETESSQENMAASVEETSKTELKTSAKPQGGKYVSIPVVGVDAYRMQNGDRVLGVGRASIDAE